MGSRGRRGGGLGRCVRAMGGMESGGRVGACEVNALGVA